MYFPKQNNKYILYRIFTSKMPKNILCRSFHVTTSYKINGNKTYYKHINYNLPAEIGMMYDEKAWYVNGEYNPRK